MNLFLLTLAPFGMMAIGAAVIFAGIHFLIPKTAVVYTESASRNYAIELRTERSRRRKAERNVKALSYAQARNSDIMTLLSRATVSPLDRTVTSPIAPDANVLTAASVAGFDSPATPEDKLLTSIFDRLPRTTVGYSVFPGILKTTK